MKNRLWIITAIFFNFALPAQAMKAMMVEGGRIGNGGGLIVCREANSSTIKSAELLDFYEARTQRGMSKEVDTGSWKVQAQNLINRFGKLSPMRKEIYSEWLNRFDQEAWFLKDVQMSTIPDSAHVAVPRGCAFEQGLNQQTPRFTGDHRYFVNDELWQALNDSQKAGLILHEFLYREALGYGHQDSISVRFLTGLIASPQFKTMSQDQWIDTLMQARYEMTDLLPGTPSGITFHLNLSKIWGLAPHEVLPDLTLVNDIPLRLGVCEEEGCKHFERVENPKDYYRLHSFATKMEFNGNRFEMKTASSKLEGDFIVSMARQGVAFVGSTTGKLSWPMAYTREGTNGLAPIYAETTFVMFSVSNESVASIYPDSFQGYRFLNEMNPSLPVQPFCDAYRFEVDAKGFLTGTMRIESETNEDPVYRNSCAFWKSNPLSAKVDGGVIFYSTRINSFAVFQPGTAKYLRGGFISAMQFEHAYYACAGTERECMQKHGGFESPVIQSLEIKTQTMIMVGTPSPGKNDRNTFLVGPQRMELHSSGVPKSLVANEATEVKMPDGKIRKYVAGDTVYLESNGDIRN